jgi:ubiquinol oxidase
MSINCYSKLRGELQPDAQMTFKSPHSINHVSLPESTKAAIDAHTDDLEQEAIKKEPVKTP